MTFIDFIIICSIAVPLKSFLEEHDDGGHVVATDPL
jgi:hypothetical protein